MDTVRSSELVPNATVTGKVIVVDSDVSGVTFDRELRVPDEARDFTIEGCRFLPPR